MNYRKIRVVIIMDIGAVLAIGGFPVLRFPVFCFCRTPSHNDPPVGFPVISRRFRPPATGYAIWTTTEARKLKLTIVGGSKSLSS